MEQQLLRILLHQQQSIARFEREKYQGKEEVQRRQQQGLRDLQKRQLQEKEELQRWQQQGLQDLQKHQLQEKEELQGQHDVERRELDDAYSKRIEQLHNEVNQLCLQLISSNAPSNSNTFQCDNDTISSNRLGLPLSYNAGECSGDIQVEGGLETFAIDENMQGDGCRDPGVINSLLREDRTEVMLRVKSLKTLGYTKCQLPQKLCMDEQRQQCSALRAAFADVTYVLKHDISGLLEFSEEGIAKLNSSKKRPPLFSKEKYEECDADLLWARDKEVLPTETAICTEDEEQADEGEKQNTNLGAPGQVFESGAQEVQKQQEILSFDEEPFADVWGNEDGDYEMQVTDEDEGGSTPKKRVMQEEDSEIDLENESLDGCESDNEDQKQNGQPTGLSDKHVQEFNQAKQQIQEFLKRADPQNFIQLLQGLGPSNLSATTVVQEQKAESMLKIEEVVKEVIESTKSRWKEVELPKFQKSVRKFWQQGQSSDTTEEWKKQLQYKQVYLDKQISGITKSHSSKARKSVIERACQAFIPTVQIIEEINWYLELSKLPTAPHEPHYHPLADSNSNLQNQQKKLNKVEQQQSEMEDFVPVSEDDYDCDDDFIDDTDLVELESAQKEKEFENLSNQEEQQQDGEDAFIQLKQDQQNVQVQEVVKQMINDVEAYNLEQTQSLQQSLKNLAMQNMDIDPGAVSDTEDVNNLDLQDRTQQQQQQPSQELHNNVGVQDRFSEEQWDADSNELELFMDFGDDDDEQGDEATKVKSILQGRFRSGCDLLQSMYSDLRWTGCEDNIDWLFPWQETQLDSFSVLNHNQQVIIECTAVSPITQQGYTSRGHCIMRPMQLTYFQDENMLRIGGLVEIQQSAGMWLVGIVIRKKRWSSGTLNHTQAIAEVYNLYSFDVNSGQVVKMEQIIQVSVNMLDEGLVREFLPWDTFTGEFFEQYNQHVQEQIVWFWKRALMFLESKIFDLEIDAYVCQNTNTFGENWVQNNIEQIRKQVCRKLARKQVYIGSKSVDMIRSRLDTGVMEWRVDYFPKNSVIFRYQVELITFFRMKDSLNKQKQQEDDGRCRIPRRGLPKKRKRKISEENVKEDVICINANGDQIGVTQKKGSKIQKIALDDRLDDEHFTGCPDYILKHLKYHQKMGLNFLWRNIIQERRESVSEEDCDSGGVILAHSMGLGKTLQCISFLCIFHRRFPGTRSLIVCPKNVLHNWLLEFHKWLKPYIKCCSSTSTKKDGDQACSLVAEFGNERLMVYQCKKHSCVIPSWQQDGDNSQYQTSKVLLITYGQFQRKIDENTEVGKYLLQVPNIVVADEGHVMKTHESKTCNAMRLIKTDKKIALTGYPLQNNLQEYYCMIQWVRPDYLGEKGEFEAEYGQKIKIGSAPGATADEIQQKNEAIVLFQLATQHIVQRYGPSELERLICYKNIDHVLLLLPSPWQIQIYQILIKNLQNNPIRNKSLFQHLFNAPSKFREIVCMKKQQLYEQKGTVKNEQDDDYINFSNSTLPECWQQPLQRNQPKRQSLESMSSLQFVDLTLESSDGEEEIERSDKNQSKNLADIPKPDFDEIHQILQKVEDCSLKNTPKGQLIIKILQGCLKRMEKTIIFSELIAPIQELESILEFLGYTKGCDSNKKTYLTIQGKDHNRQQQIELFQKKEYNIMVMLMSLKACSLGINVTCASNAIFIDALFNPVHVRQAIGRIHRIGKTCVSHVYRLLYDSTMEHKVYQKCTEKERLFLQVVDAEDVKPESMLDADQSLLNYQVRPAMKFEELKKQMAENEGEVINNIFKQEYAQHLQGSQGSIVQYFLHDSQLQQEEEEVVDTNKGKEILKKYVETQNKEMGQVTRSKSKRVRRLNRLYYNGEYQLD